VIKTVPAVKVSSVFVSRCDPKTTTDAFQSFLEKKNWQIGLVEKLKTKFNTYSSFRIDILRNNEPESEFLKPAHWPVNMLVKRYNRSRPTNFRRPNGPEGTGARSQKLHAPVMKQPTIETTSSGRDGEFTDANCRRINDGLEKLEKLIKLKK